MRIGSRMVIVPLLMATGAVFAACADEPADERRDLALDQCATQGRGTVRVSVSGACDPAASGGVLLVDVERHNQFVIAPFEWMDVPAGPYRAFALPGQGHERSPSPTLSRKEICVLADQDATLDVAFERPTTPGAP